VNCLYDGAIPGLPSNVPMRTARRPGSSGLCAHSAPPHAEQKTFARDIIADFAKQVLDGAIVYAKDTETMVKVRIAQLDALISAQLNEVMHAPEFQKLEGSWRGLHYLVHQSETSPNLKVKVFNVSKRDLIKDLERAPEFVFEVQSFRCGGVEAGRIELAIVPSLLLGVVHRGIRVFEQGLHGRAVRGEDGNADTG